MTDKFIPYSTQDIDETDIEAVVAVLKDPFITQGPTVDRFEESVQRYCDVPHAVAVSSATAGLHVALAALGGWSGQPCLGTAYHVCRHNQRCPDARRRCGFR